MDKRSFLFVVLLLSFLSVPSRHFFAIAAEEEEKIKDGRSTFRYHTVTTPEGLTFRLPEDMPIERRDGIVAPIPFDEYMYGKFKAMDRRLKQIEAKLDRIIQTLSAWEKRDQRG